MKDVVARRDDNWKKLQQYVLDEREEIVLNGPGGVRMWGEQRDYTWFIATASSSRARSKPTARPISEADRRKFEDAVPSRHRATRRARTPRGSGKRGARRAPASARSPAPDNNDNADSNAPPRLNQRRRADPPDAPAAVRVVGVLPAIQVRRGPVRARRPRDSSRAATSCASSTTRRSCTADDERRRGRRGAPPRSDPKKNGVSKPTSAAC